MVSLTKFSRTVSAGFFLATLAAPLAIAQEESTIVLDKLECKTVMALSGNDRDTTISFIHGYLAGKAGKDSVDLEALTDATEKFVDTCLDNPKSGAFKTMEALVSK